MLHTSPFALVLGPCLGPPWRKNKSTQDFIFLSWYHSTLESKEPFQPAQRGSRPFARGRQGSCAVREPCELGHVGDWPRVLSAAHTHAPPSQQLGSFVEGCEAWWTEAPWRELLPNLRKCSKGSQEGGGEPEQVEGINTTTGDFVPTSLKPSRPSTPEGTCTLSRLACLWALREHRCLFQSDLLV